MRCGTIPSGHQTIFREFPGIGSMSRKTTPAIRMEGTMIEFCLFPGALFCVFFYCQIYWISNLHMKTGRNDPCPCGSGKKYKKCCLHAAPQVRANSGYIYTDLDHLSNQVPDLIEQENYDEAERLCQRLLKQFPEQIDGLHRFAEVFEAKGNNRKAVEYYRKSAKFASQADGFDYESVEFFLKKAEQLAGAEDR